MTVSRERLFRELEGKTVALVGNARSLGSSSHGSLIDSHDIVVRFNRVPIVSRRSHGFRTDWIATGIPLDQSRLDNLGASRVLWMSPYRRKMTADTILLRELYVHPVKEIHVLAENARVERPTTGLTAIELFRRSTCRAVDLYGFDFYATQSSSSHQTIENAPHTFDREEAHVRQILSKDKRFSLVL
nr:glycosyltransferase family 29 protein [Rhizobium sp. ARZ01]